MSELSHDTENTKNISGIDQQNTTGGSTTSGGGSYVKIGETDVTVGGFGEDMVEDSKIQDDGIEIEEEQKVSGSNDECSDDSDEIDKEISKLE